MTFFPRHSKPVRINYVGFTVASGLCQSHHQQMPNAELHGGGNRNCNMGLLKELTASKGNGLLILTAQLSPQKVNSIIRKYLLLYNG
jgi:hypothetical protein